MKKLLLTVAAAVAMLSVSACEKTIREARLPLTGVVAAAAR